MELGILDTNPVVSRFSFLPCPSCRQIPQLKRMTSKWYWLFLFSKLSHYKQKMNNVSQFNIVGVCNLRIVCAIILSIRIFCISLLKSSCSLFLLPRKSMKAYSHSCISRWSCSSFYTKSVIGNCRPHLVHFKNKIDLTLRETLRGFIFCFSFQNFCYNNWSSSCYKTMASRHTHYALFTFASCRTNSSVHFIKEQSLSY